MMVFLAGLFNLNCSAGSRSKLRHAKSREPGNLVPGQFWKKLRTFFRIQRFLDYLSIVGFYIDKTKALNDFQFQYIHA